MTLNQLLYFEKVAELGNMGQAANVLHVAQPSLSVAIANLEKELNVSLFNRSGHRLALSPEGQQFLVHVRKIKADVQEAEIHMRSLSADQDTQIHIGCIAPVLYDYLPSAIRAFLDLPANQNVKVDFVTDNTSILVSKLRDGYFNFLICSEVKESDIIQTVLLEEPYALLCPPGAPVPTTWEDLLERDLIGFHVKAAAHHEVHQMLLQKGIQATYLYRAPDEESIASLVSHGFGYGIVPVVDSIRNYDLQIAPLPSPNNGMIRRIYLTQLANRPPVGASKRFMKFILNYKK